MERRILGNYWVDPDLLGSYLPAPFTGGPTGPGRAAGQSAYNERIKAAPLMRAALRCWPITLPARRNCSASPRHVRDVRMRATMASCDAPSLPTGMMGRNENLAASAEVFGLVAAGCGVRIVVAGE
jgi:hypothetical protein